MPDIQAGTVPSLVLACSKSHVELDLPVFRKNYIIVSHSTHSKTAREKTAYYPNACGTDSHDISGYRRNSKQRYTAQPSDQRLSQQR